MHAMARETPLARNCAVWLAGWEPSGGRGRDPADRGEGTRSPSRLPAGPFTLTAKADRIELDADGGGGHRLQDRLHAQRQTGGPGLSPQLTLTAAILAEGRAFPCAPPTPA
jgi:ATP-dependent helicase/nuclease subunit B